MHLEAQQTPCFTPWKFCLHHRHPFLPQRQDQEEEHEMAPASYRSLHIYARNNFSFLILFCIFTFLNSQPQCKSGTAQFAHPVEGIATQRHFGFTDPGSPCCPGEMLVCRRLQIRLVSEHMSIKARQKVTLISALQGAPR